MDGCDADEDVVNSFPKENYQKTFPFRLGTQKLPYEDGAKDFVICSCVIQHLDSFAQLEEGLKEIARVIKSGGTFFLLFKSGNNDTLLTRFNGHYKEQRTFRVYHPDDVTELLNKLGLEVEEKELYVDNNWIPYTQLILRKK